MDERLRRTLTVVALLVLGAMSACARPVGDFGRAKASVLHDDIMPAIGNTRADLSGEPVSSFNLTDEEGEMHDRVWRFLVAPHAKDWFFDTVVELQRTRIIGARDYSFEPSRYYRWLHESDYASSHVRFLTVADNARSDVDTAPSTFRAICRVIEIDGRRAIASRELRGLEYDEVIARHAENEMFIAWFTRAIRYRYEAYSYALDHLLVETPHEEAVEADDRIAKMQLYVEQAERGDFCFDAEGRHGHVDEALPARVLVVPKDEGAYLK